MQRGLKYFAETMKTGGQNLRLSGYCFLRAKSVTLTLKCLLPRMEGSFFNKTSREVAFIVLSSFLPAGLRLALLMLKYSALEFHSNHAGEGKLLPIVLYSFCCSNSCQKIPHAILCDGLFSIMHKMAAPAYLWKQQTYRHPRVEERRR